MPFCCSELAMAPQLPGKAVAVGLVALAWGFVELPVSLLGTFSIHFSIFAEEGRLGHCVAGLLRMSAEVTWDTAL